MYNPNDPLGDGSDISALRSKERKDNAKYAAYVNDAGMSPQDYARKFPQNPGENQYSNILKGAPENIQSALGMPPPMTEFVKDPRDNDEAAADAYKQYVGDYQKTVQDWAKTQPGYQPPAGQAAQPTQNVADPLGAQPVQPAAAPTPFKNDKGVEISSTYAAAYPGAASAMGYAAPSGTTPATTAPAQPPALGAAPGQAPQPAPTMAAAPLAPKPPTAAGRSIMAGTYGAGANNSYGMGSGWDQEKYNRPLG
jgi:hypothetical protein